MEDEFLHTRHDGDWPLSSFPPIERRMKSKPGAGPGPGWNSARTISCKVVLSFQFFVHLTCYDDDYYYSNCCYCYYIVLLSSWTIGFLIVGGLKSEITKAGPALTGSHWAMLTFPQVTTWCRNCPPKHLENHDKSDAWLTVWGGITWNHLNDMWCCFFLKVADFLFLGPEFLVKTSLQKPANRQPLWVAFLASFISPIENLQEMDQFGRSFQTLTVRLRVLRQLISKVSKKQPPKVGLGIWEIQGPTEKKHTHTHIYIYLDQQTSRKKRLFWSMTLFLANWPILGQIGQFNPNDPKWQKSGWNLIFYVFPWCPIPQLHFLSP